MLEQFYRRLLVMSSVSDLGEVLRLLARVASCDLIYVEIGDLMRGYSPANLPQVRVRERVESEFLQRSIDERRTVQVPLAPDPMRWREGGVALSTPIGCTGALYAERRSVFTADDEHRFEAIAHHLSSVAPALQASRQSLAEEVRALKQLRIRQAMQRHRSIAEVARVLGISRMTIYRTLDVTTRDIDDGQVNQNETDPTDVSLDETQIVSKPRSARQIEIASRERY